MSSAEITRPADTLSQPGLSSDSGAVTHPWAVLWIVLGGLFTVSFTITLLVVSLKQIATDLHSSKALLTWAITGPMLAFAVVGPAFGKAGDLWGHKRVFIGGLAVAGAFAFATGLAWNGGSMVAFRVLSASAGAACGPATLAYINRLFPAELRVKPLGYYSFVTGGAPVLGVVAGGPLIDAVGWRAIFFVQAPLCFIGVALAMWLLPDTARMPGVRFDVAGSVTLGAGASLVLAAISQGPHWGWTSAATLTCLVVGAASLMVFVVVEQRVADPLVRLEWFRTRNVAFPMLTQALGNCAYMGSFILAPLVLQDALSLSTVEVGHVVIARPLAYSLAAPLAGAVAVRAGERSTAVAGAVAVTLSMLCWATVGAHSSIWFVVLALALSGLGLGVAFPALTALVAGAVHPSELGVAGAMQQLMTQLGAVVGTVVLATVSVDAGPGHLGSYHVAFIVATVIAAAGVVAAWFVRSTPRR
jgi:MFS family permease